MPKGRKPYPPEFKVQILNIYRTGSTVAEMARAFVPHSETIKNGVRLADIDRGEEANEKPQLSPEEEIRHLRRKLKRLQQERDILAKAAAWFA